MRSIFTGIVLSLLVFTSIHGHSASKYKKSLDKKIGAYLESGVVIGGRVGKGYSLLNVRRNFAPKENLERVVLDLGDLNGKPVLGEISYFHVSIEQKPSRAVIDLSQVGRSGVDQDKLYRIFKKSPLVKSAEITYDPEDATTNLVLNFFQPTKVEVFRLSSPDTPSRIVLDLKPVKITPRRNG